MKAPHAAGRLAAILIGMAALTTRLAPPALAASPAGDHAAPGNTTGMSVHADPEAAWTALVAGNRRFAFGKTRRREPVARREAVLASASPVAIVVTSSDSRVVPELIFDQDLGDLFVVRTAPAGGGDAVLASIDHALEASEVPLLVVLGHAAGDPSPDEAKQVDATATALAAGSGSVKAALTGGRLSIVRAVYNLDTGLVRRLP